MPQSLPPTAREYARIERTEIGAAVAAMRRQWQRMGPDFDFSWILIENDIIRTLDVAQERLTAAAFEYAPAVMDELGMRVPEPDYEFSTGALVGSAGDGRPTDSLLYGGVTRAKAAVATGAPVALALEQGGQFLTMAAGTVLSDTGRTAEKVAGHARRVTYYVRMLNPPSCGRCIILAGRGSRQQEAFLRHPGCDCRNIPADEAIAGDLTVDPHEYLDALDDEGLAQALGSKANAKAWQEGADANQLVNAYRAKGSVSTAQQYDHTVKYTTEGTTRRGIANRTMQRWSKGPTDARGRVRVTERRLMPETIYELAKDRADAQRLLRMYGWMG